MYTLLLEKSPSMRAVGRMAAQQAMRPRYRPLAPHTEHLRRRSVPVCGYAMSVLHSAICSPRMYRLARATHGAWYRAGYSVHHVEDLGLLTVLQRGIRKGGSEKGDPETTIIWSDLTLTSRLCLIVCLSDPTFSDPPLGNRWPTATIWGLAVPRVWNHRKL